MKSDLDELRESLQELREISRSWDEFLKRLLKRGESKSGEEDKGKQMEQGWSSLIEESVKTLIEESVKTGSSPLMNGIEELKKLLLIGFGVLLTFILVLTGVVLFRGSSTPETFLPCKSVITINGQRCCLIENTTVYWYGKNGWTPYRTQKICLPLK